MPSLGQNKKPSDFPGGDREAHPQAAAQVFAANCAGCHGLDGKGGERAPDIATRLEIRQLPDSKVFQILERGVPGTSMPSFSYLGDETLRTLVAYLRKLGNDRNAATLAGNAKRGKELFFGSAGCSGCHMVRGQGGFFGSDLTVYALGRSPDKILDAIINPYRDLDPARRTAVAILPTGKVLEGIARNEDNFSIQLLTKDGTLHLLSKSSLTSLTRRNESPMPADYGTRLSATERTDLVSYLSSVAKQDSKRNATEKEPD
jgi:cytochrome c oxidase cbb3-type subunit 3